MSRVSPFYAAKGRKHLPRPVAITQGDTKVAIYRLGHSRGDPGRNRKDELLVYTSAKAVRAPISLSARVACEQKKACLSQNLHKSRHNDLDT